MNKLMNKRGQITILTSIATALLTFGILIAMGMVILQKFGDTTATCTDGYLNVQVTNEVGNLNSSGYQTTYSLNNKYGFTDATVTALYNATDYTAIPIANATINTTGFIKNATKVEWNKVNISYNYTWDNTHTWNTTSQKCVNASAGDAQTGSGTAFTTISAVSTYMGTSGLAGWIPVIIVVLVAGLIMTLFGSRRKGRSY